MAKNIKSRSEDYSQWYLDVIKAGDLADYAPVRGCMVIKPTGYAIWEEIQKVFDAEFKRTGHKNAYFPLLIPYNFLTKEAEHVEGFSPECAMVTHAGGEELEEPYAIRPTSETVIGHMYSKWIQSYRDLPILYNQWCNIMRWEKRSRLFLRTSEFLWQEGHTAHETEQEAREETLRMLEVYRKLMEDVLALPVLTGEKTAGERFPGAVDTYTCEAMMSDKRALQSGTSHFLGRNFAEAFEIKFQNRQGELEYCWTTSWGISTRLIGALIMTHSDDDGLILPPKIAPVKAAIVPISQDDKFIDEILLPKAKEIASIIDNLYGFNHVVIDKDFHMRPGDRFFTHLQKGVPLRIELGEKDIKAGTARLVRRDTGEKIDASLNDLETVISRVLDEEQANLYNKAKNFRISNTHFAKNYDEFKDIIANQGGFVEAYFAGTPEDEVKIREDTGATPRCIVTGDDRTGPCIITGKTGRMTIFAKAY